MILPPLLLATLIASSCFITFAFAATLLPNDEADALEEIAHTLGKTDWNFTADPCSQQWGWATRNSSKGFENNVTCDCSFSNNTVCHVVSIVLKSQNLTGVLPGLGKLPYLKEIDLTRNYLNGTIPPEWGSTQLVNISLYGNRLTGSIPKEIGNITTLGTLTVEFNQLSGNLPPELGNLSHIERLGFSSNNFTGELPTTFAKLTTLKDFRISDNNFTGTIPNFITNWTNIEKLVIQASGLDGSIPPGIASLENITLLRISDLKGTNTFPPVNNMTNLETLILRSCNITGKIPEYLSNMTELKVLDLSFNRLSEEIPSSFNNQSGLDFMYLTGNLLVGHIPDWITRVGNYIDLSYNNFTFENSSALSCGGKLNLFRSSLGSNNSGTDLCLGSTTCPQTFDSFHINCGGKVFTDGNTKYEEDTNQAGSASFFKSETNWAFSSTGDFMDDNSNTDSFIWTNKSALAMKNSELYMDARLSPLSLTYYGFCLRTGNYEVKLHFAETRFTDDKTYSSLGRRIFDVYIQGKLVLKDFNIEDEAGGVGKVIIKKFTAVVDSSTLEIRFYWAGKGTTAIPESGVYGPLISAISVNLEKGSSISTGAVVGIVVAVAFVIFVILGIVLCKGRLRHRYGMEQDLKGLDLQTGSFTLRQIKAATNNFDAANKIGEGGFGPVYKGLLSDGTRIAVKQLSSKSKQGNREFVNEIGIYLLFNTLTL